MEDGKLSVFYCPTIPTFGLRRLIYIERLLATLAVFLAACFLRTSVIHAHGQEAATIALKVKKLAPKLKVIFDAHGVAPEEYELGCDNPSQEQYKALNLEEAPAFLNSDAVICVSESMRSHYGEKHGFRLENTVVVPCATRIVKSWSDERRENVREKLGIKDKLVFVYAGSFRNYQLAPEMVNLFKTVRQAIPEAFFLILTGHVEEFRAAADHAQVDPRDYCIRNVDHEEVFTLLSGCDVGLLLRSDHIVNKVSSPTKFAEYCACGVPVLITPFVGDYSADVQRVGVGCCISNLECDDYLVQFLRRVQSTRREFALRCQVHAGQKLVWPSAGIVLIDLYRGLCREAETG